MIAQTWRGWTAPDTADEYAAFLREVALREYGAIPGNLGAYGFRRPSADGVEFLTLSVWESLGAVPLPANGDGRRGLYPEDSRHVVGRQSIASRWEIVK